MSKRTWANVGKGNAVELAGRVWIVTKIKPHGKKATVRLERKGRTSDGEVRLKDPVKIVTASADRVARENRWHEHADALLDRNGAQNRWATKRELADVLGRGDADATKPPAKAKGRAWDDAKIPDATEKLLAKGLGARLVGESAKGEQGYYVPEVDVSTVAAHLALFHGGIPAACDDETKMLSAHAAQHLAAGKGEGLLAVQHWHVERRP